MNTPTYSPTYIQPNEPMYLRGTRMYITRVLETIVGNSTNIDGSFDESNDTNDTNDTKDDPIGDIFVVIIVCCIVACILKSWSKNGCSTVNEDKAKVHRAHLRQAARGQGPLRGL